MTKKEFAAKCSVHPFGKHFNGVYYDWQDTDKGRGSKYAIYAHKKIFGKAALMQLMYEWAIQGKTKKIEALRGHFLIDTKYAATDKDRFKYPLSMHFMLHDNPERLADFLSAHFLDENTL